MSHLIGTYQCKVDPKGRVKIPAALSKQMATTRQQPFVVKRAVFQPCLELYSLSEWNALMEKVNKLNRFKKKTTISFVVLLLVSRLLNWMPQIVYWCRATWRVCAHQQRSGVVGCREYCRNMGQGAL